MKKAIAGMLLALSVLGAAAGLSGREMANEELERIKNQWAALQSMPAGERPAAAVTELRREAHGLATRFPGREEILIWERVIERSTRDWRHYPGGAS
ncbi:hypothetical protein H0Z60_02910 [Ectothiorhodospiraceae bacterium WFHF3C12]|nr:hypothetical protein [Ectothiorhodospiraceae bacterium WFHF3C12]